MTTQEWEKRFDDLYANKWQPGHKHDETCEWVCNLREQIKEFFRFELSHAKEEERRRVVDCVPAILSQENSLWEDTEIAWRQGWNACRAETLEGIAALTPKV